MKLVLVPHYAGSKWPDKVNKIGRIVEKTRDGWLGWVGFKVLLNTF